MLVGTSGCARKVEKVPVVQIERLAPEIPTTLRQCKKVPEIPGEEATQKNVATFLVDLLEAYEDCESKHRTVVGVIDDFKWRIENSGEDTF